MDKTLSSKQLEPHCYAKERSNIGENWSIRGRASPYILRADHRIGTTMVFGGYRIIISTVCVFLFAWVRITEEEKLMSNQFGEDFAKYKKEVW